MRRDLNIQTKMSIAALLKLFKVNVSLSHMSWKLVPQPPTIGSAAAKHLSP